MGDIRVFLPRLSLLQPRIIWSSAGPGLIAVRGFRVEVKGFGFGVEVGNLKCKSFGFGA